MKVLYAVTALLLFACTQPENKYNEFLRACNRVDIVVYNGGDTLFFNTQDSTGIAILQSQISGNQNNVKDTCAALGLLRFHQDSTTLLEAPFAVSAGKNDANCNYVAYNHDDASHVQALSDRAKRLLNKVLQQAAK